MGIPKLTSFVNNYFAGWKREKITGYIVIDGFSLCHYLYSFDWSHGGQYPQFHTCVLEYFEALHVSNIDPIVVFDGIDYKQEKVKTTMRRRKEWIQSINEHIMDSRSRQRDVVHNLLPLLAIEEFQYTLSKLGIKQVVVDGEADTTIAQLANYYFCPVLSKDSDFYMYVLRGGFIHMDRFHWNSKPIEADVYHVNLFIDQFDFRHESIRLIIPAIAGNDFLPAIHSRRFISERATVLQTSKSHPILSIVCYASRFKNFDDFISMIPFLDHLPEKDTLQHNCSECKQMYDCCEARSLTDVIGKTELIPFDKSIIPRWILDQFRSCNLRNFIMDAVVLHKCVLRIAVDDFHQPSSLVISRPLRQTLYYILNIKVMTEHIRYRLDILGEKITAYTDGKNLPSLDQIPSLQLGEKIIILYSILECNIEEIEKLDCKWRLVIASVVFWVLHAKVPTHIVKALLLCFVHCFHRIGGDFLRGRIPHRFIEGPEWLKVLHFFAQWQSTYLDALSINQVLQLPIEYCSPAELYDGKLAFYFASLRHDITSAETKLSVSEKPLYQLLLDVVFSHCTMVSAEATGTRKMASQGKHVSSVKKSMSIQTLFEHPNRFSILNIDSSDPSSTEDD